MTTRTTIEHRLRRARSRATRFTPDEAHAARSLGEPSSSMSAVAMTGAEMVGFGRRAPFPFGARMVVRPRFRECRSSSERSRPNDHPAV